MNQDRSDKQHGKNGEHETAVAARILEASRQILARDGWKGLTISAICRESGAYRAAVSYHFGSKEGLAGVLLESLVHDAAHRMLSSVRGLPLGELRVRETVRGFDMLGGRDLQVAFFEAFTHLIRDAGLRTHLERLYDDANGMAALAISGGNPMRIPELHRYAVMLVAFADGLIIQQLISPDRDFEPAIEAFSAMLTPIVFEIVKGNGLAAGESGDPATDSDDNALSI